MDLLLQEVEEAVKAKKTVVVLTGSKENSRKIEEMLRENGVGNDAPVVSKGVENASERSDEGVGPYKNYNL